MLFRLDHAIAAEQHRRTFYQSTDSESLFNNYFERVTQQFVNGNATDPGFLLALHPLFIDLPIPSDSNKALAAAYAFTALMRTSTENRQGYIDDFFFNELARKLRIIQ